MVQESGAVATTATIDHTSVGQTWDAMCGRFEE